jgi:hypothetical protein
MSVQLPIINCQTPAIKRIQQQEHIEGSAMWKTSSRFTQFNAMSLAVPTPASQVSPASSMPSSMSSSLTNRRPNLSISVPVTVQPKVLPSRPSQLGLGPRCSADFHVRNGTSASAQETAPRTSPQSAVQQIAGRNLAPMANSGASSSVSPSRWAIQNANIRQSDDF